MFLVSAIIIYLCAWLMDKCKVPKWIWLVLLMAVIIGMSMAYAANKGHCESWKRGAISTVVPESYDVTDSDFDELYLIPKTLIGGMMGFYITFALGAVYSLGILFFNRFMWIKA